jgi:hypothetical protein
MAAASRGLAEPVGGWETAEGIAGGPPKEEPLNQLLPLVEFSFDTPRGQRTGAVRCCPQRAADRASVLA